MKKLISLMVLGIILYGLCLGKDIPNDFATILHFGYSKSITKNEIESCKRVYKQKIDCVEYTINLNTKEIRRIIYYKGKKLGEYTV